MIAALVLIAFVQDVSVDDRIAAFVKGDAAARAELVKLGAFAIRPLQKARDKSPEKIDALVYELKKAAAYPACAEVIAELEIPKTCDRNETSLDSLFVHLTGGKLVETVDLSRVTHEGISVTRNNVPARILLDEICRQVGLDYGIFHNRLVVGRPETLWPDGPPGKIPELDEKSRARAAELVGKLGDDELGIREAATRELIAMGPAVAGFLESALPRLGGEAAAGCSSILSRVKRVPKPRLGAPGVARQKLAGADADLLKRIKDWDVGVDTQNQNVRFWVYIYSATSPIPIEVDSGLGEGAVFIRARKTMAFHDVLALMTQLHELDFVIRDGVVRIVKPEGVEIK